METFGGLESNEKTIDIQGDRGCPLTAKQDGDRINKNRSCTSSIRKKRNEPQNIAGVAIRRRNGVLCLERDAWSTVKRLKQETNESAPPPRGGFSPALWGWRRMATTV